MLSLRSVRFNLSIAMSALSMLHCAGEATMRGAPGTAASPVSEAAGWMDAVPQPDTAEGGAEAAVAAHLAKLQAPRWAYQGDHGPERWGELSPEYEKCRTGENQSPIDIVTGKVEADRFLELIDFGYASMPLHAFNNGHTLQVTNTTPAAINAAGDTWKLTELSFHSPSEHSINGKFADLEVQLAHVNREGDVAMVSVLFKKGRENQALAPMFDSVPAELTGVATVIPDAAIDLWNLIPRDPSFFTYMGSLTTPKCTEGVRWFVLQPVGEVSEGQLQKLRAVSRSDTNRPVQPLGTRSILRPE